MMVGIIMGSDSDYDVMAEAVQVMMGLIQRLLLLLYETEHGAKRFGQHAQLVA